MEALQAYLKLVVDVTGPAELDTLQDPGYRLAMAGARFDDAHFDYLEEFAPIGDAGLLCSEDDDDDDDEDDDDEIEQAIAAGGAITVLTRQDFVMTDPAAVFDAAREAWARLNGQPATDAVVSSMGHALYELTHDGGRDRLDDCPGLVPTASITLFQQQGAPLNGASLDEADESEVDYGTLFTAGGETLFSFGERWC